MGKSTTSTGPCSMSLFVLVYQAGYMVAPIPSIPTISPRSPSQWLSPAKSNPLCGSTRQQLAETPCTERLRWHIQTRCFSRNLGRVTKFNGSAKNLGYNNLMTLGLMVFLADSTQESLNYYTQDCKRSGKDFDLLNSNNLITLAGWKMLGNSIRTAGPLTAPSHHSRVLPTIGGWANDFRTQDKIMDKHGSLNVPIEHHPTIRYIVCNGYYKVMSNIPKMGHLPTPDKIETVWCKKNMVMSWSALQKSVVLLRSARQWNAKQDMKMGSFLKSPFLGVSWKRSTSKPWVSRLKWSSMTTGW